MATEKLKIDTRRNKIIEILNRDGQVRVSQLSKKMGTTMVTIRSDLDALEKAGYLERIQGGAVQTSFNNYNLEFLRKKKEHSEAKKRIATAVSGFIHDGDTILINSGTTTYYTAIELKKHKNLNIVTNSLTVAIELGSCPSLKVILLGGETNSQDSFTYGNDVLEQLKRYKANYAILSIDGVCPEEGVAAIHAEEAMVDRMMMERAKETVIVADSQKLGKEGFVYVCDLKDIDKLVTEKGAEPGIVRQIRDAGIEVISG
ncbi:DeoR/GlpR family DNA-binding transcription regulator [Eubacteriales bacterium mix99]|jgi:DeoR/GlpR family transcriptional regulator of sugar metabolism